ncbi:hypothetical protein LOZ23_006900, partial [Ophidiomyces ophidiicola]
MYKTTLAAYALMHLLYFLAVIVLHRAHMPFLPLGAATTDSDHEPSAAPLLLPPLDEFWRDGARDAFRAARQLLELATTCFERGVLPETPLAGFAIYQAALLGVYAAHFGSSSGAAAVDADADAALCSPSGQVAVRRALELLAAMRHRLPLAVGWLRTLHRLHAFVGRARRPRKSEAGVVPEAAVIRDAGGGGGGDELRLLDVLFAELGAPEDQLADTTATAMVTAAAVTANGDEPPPVKSEASDERRDA